MQRNQNINDDDETCWSFLIITFSTQSRQSFQLQGAGESAKELPGNAQSPEFPWTSFGSRQCRAIESCTIDLLFSSSSSSLLPVVPYFVLQEQVQ
jgi:hypothetical protein